MTYRRTGRVQRVDGPVVVLADVFSPASCERITNYYRQRDSVRFALDIADDFATDPVLWAAADMVGLHAPSLNATYWHLGTLGMSGAQVLRYAVGRGHERHADGGLDVRYRWLGMASYLTGPDEYEGGDLVVEGSADVVFLDRSRNVVCQFDAISTGDHMIRPARGSTVFLPGHVEHEVMPMTGGRREVFALFAKDVPADTLKARPRAAA